MCSGCCSATMFATAPRTLLYSVIKYCSVPLRL